MKDLSKLNFFEIFGLEISFDIDRGILEKSYLSLQLQFHPDRNIFIKDPREKLLVTNNSFLLQKAYNVLISDIEKGNYLLGQLVGDLAIKEGHTEKDLELLSEIMEINEEIEDAGEDAGKLEEIKKRLQEKCNLIKRDLSEVFRELALETSNISLITKTKKLLVSLKYYQKIVEEV